MVTVNVRLQRHHPEPAIPAAGRGNECTGLAKVGVVVGCASFVTEMLKFLRAVRLSS